MTDKKTKSTSSSKTKRASGKNRSSAKKGGFWKKLWQIGWKLAITFAVVFVCYGFYLDHIIKQKFAGQLFELPTVVYARILSLSPGDDITLDDVKHELDVLNYRKVANPTFAGEYSASSSKIEMIRRPFEFADGPEPQRHVMLYFNGNELSRIYSIDKNADLGFLRIEPKMLGMLEKTNEQRLYLHREQFPEVMVDALLATEDRNFYHHDGVSLISIGRAFVANIRAGHTVQGGSTLTQQLAKNIFLSRERTMWRKLQEAYMALIIDHRYSKDRILEAYLNEVYLGQNGSESVHGFGLAARLYFGQPIKELRIDQLALLVGMVKGPSYYNPVRHPERAKARRDLVLKLMLEQDILTANQYAQAVERPLDVQQNPHIARRQPAYFEQLSIELADKVGDKFKSDTGLRVFTTLDPVSQSELEKAVAQTVPTLGDNNLQAAAIAVDRSTGEIRAMVGGKDVHYDGFNRVLNASRQIGSLAKPAVYLTALSQPDKYNLATTLVDAPITLQSEHGDTWQPQNFERTYRGDIPLYMGLVHSINVPTVKLGMDLGIKAVSQTLINLGVDPHEIRPVPSMFLGSFTLTPIQVAQMYQTLTNSGQRAKLSALRSVVDLNGNVLYQSVPKSSQAVNQQAAWLTTYAMKKVVQEGTGRYLNRKFGWAALAGKTGTTNDYRDSWFVGVDGREVTTIWVGRDDNKPTGLTGASGALRVYADYLDKRTPKVLTLPWPQGITMVGFEKDHDGSLSLDCGGDDKLPVWDVNGDFKKRCEEQSKPLNWLKHLFSW